MHSSLCSFFVRHIGPQTEWRDCSRGTNGDVCPFGHAAAAHSHSNRSYTETIGIHFFLAQVRWLCLECGVHAFQWRVSEFSQRIQIFHRKQPTRKKNVHSTCLYMNRQRAKLTIRRYFWNWVKSTTSPLSAIFHFHLNELSFRSLIIVHLWNDKVSEMHFPRFSEMRKYLQSHSYAYDLATSIQLVKQSKEKKYAKNGNRREWISRRVTLTYRSTMWKPLCAK